MKIFKQQSIQVIDRIICDICGNISTEYAEVKASWGYGSKNDGKRYDIDLCENCFYDTIGWMDGRSKHYNYTPNINPFRNIDDA